MSRKHNTKHLRSRSNYPQRLLKRGVTAAKVRMPSLEQLRRRAGAIQEGAEPEPWETYGTQS